MGRHGNRLLWRRFAVYKPVEQRGAVPPSCRPNIRVPEGFDGCGLILSVRQAPGQICHFDNMAVYRLGW